MLKYLEFEESIGKVWDSFLTNNTAAIHKEAEVGFADLSKSLTLFYRLLGGDKSKDIKITDKRTLAVKRTFLQKISGYGTSFYLPWQDEDALYLPGSLAYLPTKNLNRMLYFWLVAMAVNTDATESNFKDENKKASLKLLEKYEGFNTFFQKAVSSLNSSDSENLTDAYPFYMAIFPPLKNRANTAPSDDEPQRTNGNNKTETLKMKKKANQMDDKKETDGFMAFLPEGLMSILEQVNVDRSEDDSFDEDALYNAEDLDEITMGQKNANLSARIKMDLDLTTETKEIYPTGKGRFIDEWDYTQEKYLHNYVRIQPIVTTNVKPLQMPKKLQILSKKIQSQLDLLELDRVKNNRLSYGDEINLDTWIDYKGHQNRSLHHQNFYENFEKKTRDMSTLILADISLSTEAGITQEIRVIDMIKESLMVFSQSLEKLRDRFAIYAFSSNKNTNVRFHIIKNFKEKFSDLILGRIEEIKPGYYTRLGAAIRESLKIIVQQKNQNRLLLIISDGKPNDLDRYDGRYGIEDTKKAIEEVKKKGISPFCITIDVEAKEYLPYLFGKNGYVVVKESRKLPKIIPEIYINLTK